MTEKPIRQLANNSVRTNRIQPALTLLDLSVQDPLFDTFIAIEKAEV